MILSSEKKRINNYLRAKKSWPIIVDLQTREALKEIQEYFSVGDNHILAADSFCSQDGTFKLEEFYNTLSSNAGNTFVIGLTAFLKINGDTFTRKVLKELLSKNINGHVVILTYQCKNYLRFTDSRYSERGQIIVASGEPDTIANICLISPELADAFSGCYNGFNKLATAIESGLTDTIYIATSVDCQGFGESIYNITHLTNGYDVLCSRDARTKNVPCSFGSTEQWNYALKEMKNGDWMTLIARHFGSLVNLAHIISMYPQFDDNKKWLYYIVLSIFGVRDNPYLQLAVQNAENYAELIKSLYRSILLVDSKSIEFQKMYGLRKKILKDMPLHNAEVVSFCKVVSVKEKESVYYLTDLTQLEKQRIIEWLDVYGYEFSNSELIIILRTVYPDLAYYLSPFRYKNIFLNEYFADYKYQKAINRLLPSFEATVDEQSTQKDFVSILMPRTSLVDKLDVTDAHAYFVDALGIEYLAYIQEKCRDYGLAPSISTARCELPSLTVFNKEFVETIESKGCKISDIKDLDEIKHHGENNFDYEKVKTPIYLITELEIIDSLLKKIKANIDNGLYKKAIILSDHGASRLAVLHNTENVWDMGTKGVHSGRCCPQNEITEKPDFAIEEEGFWILANYDRFRGGRKANCEVHGGASLEEVAVPIIEITQKQNNIEAFIVDSSKVIKLGAKEHAVIKIYVGIKSQNITIKLDGEYYDAEPTTEAYIYKVDLPKHTKKGKYSCDILNGSDIIALQQPFSIEKKGLSENSLFD